MSETIELSLEDTVKQAAELEAAGRLDEAEATLDRLLERAPDNAEAIHLKGVLAVRQGRTVQGAELMRRSVEIGPVKPYYLRNMCEVYRTLGRYDEALECGRKAAAGDPADPISHANLSVLHYERGEAMDAVLSGERALAINPNLPGAHFGLAEALLLRGEFERGWEEYEWRFRMPGVPTLMPIEGVPQWDGQPLDGRLMLIADQGFGDGIQFCRYIPWAAQRCSELVVACSRELQPLIGQIPGIAKMFDRWEVAPASAAFLPLSGLPRLHGTRLDNIPVDIVPYLKPDPARVAKWKARIDELAAPHHRRVGLVWAGRPTHKNDRNRSVLLNRLSALTDLPGVTYVSLQKGPAEAQVGDYFGLAPLVNLGPEVDEFTDTLAIMDGLDLVVTVDTAVGHLAGAMGKAVFIMLPYAPDWRWLEHRSDTPWYPSVRLFRPPTPQNWDSVADEVAGAIKSLLPSREKVARRAG